MNARVTVPSQAALVEPVRVAFEGLSDLEPMFARLKDLAQAAFLLSEGLASSEDGKSPLLTLCMLLEEQCDSVGAKAAAAQAALHPLVFD